MKLYLNNQRMRHLFILGYVLLIEFISKPLFWSNSSLKLLFIPGFNGLRNFNAKAKAYAVFVRAKKNVPAYRDFLKQNGFARPSFIGLTPNIHEIPITDKENYVKIYPIEARCIHGVIPAKGVIIDESSGSSGTATNWIRGKRERKLNGRMIKFGLQNLLGSKPLFIINAFALGAWATGMNVTMACVPFAKIKSVGPDLLKITNTINHFGKDHHYVIMGYPPFLKLLADETKINWSAYQVSFIFGGESMAEGMRDYLTEKGIKRIYSSLGASDLELNIAAENDFTISLRRLIRSNESLKKRLLAYSTSVPMVFQYNPADFLMEISEMGELIITVCRPHYVAPKIRYNLHDKGQLVQINELYSILNELGITSNELLSPQTDLPILLHYGRADMTVSFFGANINPVDIQEAVSEIPELVAIVNSFYLNAFEDSEGNKQLIVAFELQQHKDLINIDLSQMQSLFFEQLAAINQDFKEAKRMIKNDAQTTISFHTFSEGPFINKDIRIKANYLKRI